MPEFEAFVGEAFGHVEVGQRGSAVVPVGRHVAGEVPRGELGLVVARDLERERAQLGNQVKIAVAQGDSYIEQVHRGRRTPDVLVARGPRDRVQAVDVRAVLLDQHGKGAGERTGQLVLLGDRPFDGGIRFGSQPLGLLGGGPAVVGASPSRQIRCQCGVVRGVRATDAVDRLQSGAIEHERA